MAATAPGPDEDRHLAHEIVPVPAAPDASSPKIKECSIDVSDSDVAIQVLQRCKVMLLHLLDAPTIKWSGLHDKEGVLISSSSTKVGTKRFKLDFVYPCSPKRLRRLLLDERMTWDDSVKSFRQLSTRLSEKHCGTFLSHIQTGAVGIISSREFVDINHTEVDAKTGVLLSFGQSVSPPNEWTADSSCVLGSNFPGCGWRLTPCTQDGAVFSSSDGSEAPCCRIEYIIHTELNGWLPSMAVNAGMTSTLVAFVNASLKHLHGSTV